MAGAIIVNGQTTFGGMSNRMIGLLNAVNEEMNRLQAAQAAASAGYTGTAGTQFEGNATNFGVVASSTPGAQGLAWQSALGNLAQTGGPWQTFWTAAAAYIQALDNGVTIQS